MKNEEFLLRHCFACRYLAAPLRWLLLAASLRLPLFASLRLLYFLRWAVIGLGMLYD